ncbi:TPA: hypothetical protein ACYLN4_000625 [Burkholderia lata]
MDQTLPSGVSAPPIAIRLTPLEKQWLERMATRQTGHVSLLIDAPPLRAMNGLAKKGLVRDIMGVFWDITAAGRERCSPPRL